jgi:hypothetical protein
VVTYYHGDIIQNLSLPIHSQSQPCAISIPFGAVTVSRLGPEISITLDSPSGRYRIAQKNVGLTGRRVIMRFHDSFSAGALSCTWM